MFLQSHFEWFLYDRGRKKRKWLKREKNPNIDNVDCLLEVLILYYSVNVKILVCPSHVLYLSLLDVCFH